LDLYYFDTLASTQTYLIEALKSKKFKAPVAILAYEQSAGLGSGDNEWTGGKGNFFASIAVDIEMLPKDLPIASASIYFSYIMKKTLESLGEKVWIKWPNDFYLKNHKIGGTITKKIGSTLVCGIGINLKSTHNSYRALNSAIGVELLLETYTNELLKFPTWQYIFSNYKDEFELSKKFFVHIENKKKSLSHAILCEDGALLIDNSKIYSLR
jgi:BirA family biotin operon repressor/biotin-[acetyl-CoA-carboxylase] ligase